MPVDVRFTIDGAEGWMAALRWKANHIVDEIQDEFRKTGQKVTDSSQRYVRANAYDTGSLMRSIDWLTAEDRDSVRLEVGPMSDGVDQSPGDKKATEYAPYVHNGTARMAPRPFMDVAWKMHEPALMLAMRRISRRIDRVKF